MLGNSKLFLVCLVLILTLVCFVGVELLLHVHPPVGLGIQRYPNAVAVVSVTNLTGASLDYLVKLERRDINGWPNYRGYPPDYAPVRNLRPGESTNLSMLVMTYSPGCPLRVSVFCYCKRSTGGLNSMVGDLLLRLHMPELAKKMWSPKFKLVQVAGPQMDNCEAGF